jgi:hypothetical protein
MPGGKRNTRRTRGGDASPNKTNDKATDTNVRTTLVRDSDLPFDSGEEDKGGRNAPQVTMETPRAPKAKRVQSRPETPNEEEEEQLDVQGTLRILCDEADIQRRYTRETLDLCSHLREANKQLSEELEKVKAELARVVAMVKASRTPEPALPKAQQEKRSTAVAATQPKPTIVPTWEPTGRERVVVVSLGEAAGKLREKPLSAIKELAQKELSNKAETKGVKVVGISAIVGERLEIQTESKEQAESARRDQGWTVVLGKDAKVKQPAWHPIKVDGVARANICKKTGNGWQFKQGLESLINKSNVRPDLPMKVMKVHWLSKPSEKAAGSMAVYLDSWEVAQQVIREGIFLIGANATYPAPFVSQERPVRCYRCNQYGHKQSIQDVESAQECTKP